MYIVTNTNNIVMYFMLSNQSLLYIKNRFDSWKKRFKIFKRQIDIRKNLSIEVDIVCEK